MKKLLLTVALATISTSSYANVKEAECLADNIYHEARGEVFDGQVAVAAVTLNRLRYKNRPDSVCGVVYQPYQFSWTIGGKKRPATSKYVSLSRDIMAGRLQDPTGGADHYWACSGANKIKAPYWAKGAKYKKIGNHCFIKLGY